MGTASFISELIRATNESSKLTPTETARLLHRAAATIRDYRQQVAYSGSIANDPSQGDIVFELTVVAASIDLFPPEKVSALLLEAVKIIKASTVLEEKTRRSSGNDPDIV